MAKVKWGIMSTASIVRKKFIPAVERAENASLFALASRSSEKAERFIREHSLAGCERTYGSYEELLQDDEIEAVYIPLPNNLHYEWSKKALKAGKHVLCEKPLVMTAAEGEELFALAEECDLFLLEGFMYRFRPLTERVIELSWMELGELQLIRGSFCYQSGRPKEDIRFRSEVGGGALRDVGCYLVDFLGNLMTTRPKIVYNDTLPADRGDVDGQGSSLLIYEPRADRAGGCPGRKIQVNLNYSITIPGSKGIEIVGTEGKLIAPEFFEWKTRGRRYIHLDKQKEVNEITLPAVDQFKNEVEYFSRTVSSWPAGREDALKTNRITVNNLAVIDALTESGDKGEPVIVK